MRKCIHCHHAVSQGDRHALSQCPPVRGSNGHRRRERLKARRRAKRDSINTPKRGEAVAGTGVPKGASKG